MKTHVTKIVSDHNHESFVDINGILIPLNIWSDSRYSTFDFPKTYDVIIEQYARNNGLLKKEAVTIIIHEGLKALGVQLK